MPIIAGKKYNDVLWKVAGKLFALQYADLPGGVSEVYISEGTQVKMYAKIRRRLRSVFRKNGMVFDEENLREEGSVSRGPKLIHIRVKPNAVELTRYAEK